jgi:hypothetical protein
VSSPPRTWPRERAAAPPTGVLAAFGLAAGLLLFQVATFQEPVDGARGPYLAGVACAGAAALLVTLWCAARRLPVWGGVLLVLAVTLPGATVHARRLQQQDAPLTLALRSPEAAREVFDVTLRGGASLRTEAGTPRVDAPPGEAIVLRTPAGSVGYLEVRRERLGVPWDAPRALLSRQDGRSGEELTWEASIERDGAYFVLVETDRLLVQLTESGLSVAQTDASGAAPQSVTRPLPNGSRQEWALRRVGRRVTLSLGGETLWQGPAGGPFGYIRLGETRSDPLHGGTLRLYGLRYRSFIDRGDPGW